MIQLIQLRTHTPNGAEKKFDRFVPGNPYADSIIDLFKNLDQYLAKIPFGEDWNCFYTLANCTAKKREFQSMSVLAFDIDGIDKTQIEAYIATVCAALQIKREETGIVASGNGLHFIIGLSTPIVDKTFFDDFRDHYKALCTNLDKALARMTLPGALDTSIFDARRIFRLPGTINKKPGKADTKAELLQPNIVNIEFDLCAASGIPRVKKDEQIDPKEFEKFPKADNSAIFKGCSFLANAKDNPQSLNEPQWYAALSITARMDNGHELSHDISKGHPAYNAQETELKIDQALNASGPRTCKSISNLWGGCQKCPLKVASPIMIRSPDEIKTERTGFHDMIFDEETGRMKRGKPNYSDLRRFFERSHTYRSHDKVVWRYTGTHYEEMKPEEIKNFAQVHFNPYATGAMRFEFLDLVQVTNLVTQEEWNAKTFEKINLRNGILDIKTKTLIPHSPEYGFKYVLPYDYDPNATSPRFEKFLLEVCEGKLELVNTLLEFGGYAISGARCKYEKALILEGEGSNGKSTFIKVLQALVGKNSYSTLSFREMDNIERRSALDGVLFNISEETPSKIFDTTSFKAMTTGGVINIRRLYRDSYKIENKAKLIFACNEMPVSTDTSYGFFRRFLIVPFNAQFSKETRDVDMDTKLIEELPGVFNLFLHGYAELLRKREFSKGDIDDKEVLEYKEDTDPVKQWISDNVTVHDKNSNQFITPSDLFKSFKTWCEDNGFDPRVKNSASLSRRMTSYVPGFKKRREIVREGEKMKRIIRGITVSQGDF